MNKSSRLNNDSRIRLLSTCYMAKRLIMVCSFTWQRRRAREYVSLIECSGFNCLTQIHWCNQLKTSQCVSFIKAGILVWSADAKVKYTEVNFVQNIQITAVFLVHITPCIYSDLLFRKVQKYPDSDRNLSRYPRDCLGEDVNESSIKYCDTSLTLLFGS